MRETSLSRKITATKAGMKAWQQERAIFEVTERICQLMDEKDVSRSELAARLSRTKGYITQILSGNANMTIRTLSDVFLALERQFHVADAPIRIECDEPPRIMRFKQDVESHRQLAGFDPFYGASFKGSYQVHA